MNNLWLKIVGTVVVVVIVLILVSRIGSNGMESEEPQGDAPTTFSEQVEQDKDEFLTLPEPVDNSAADTEEDVQDSPPEEEIVVSEPKTTTLYFKTLDEIEDIEAERLLNVAVPGRSIGRLPVTSYTLMVQTCRDIIERWPDSKYAYNAKKLLADLPERYHDTYNITPEELDVSMYVEPRTGTQPYTITEE